MASIKTSYDYKNDLTTHKVEGVFTAKEAKEKIEVYYLGNSITKNTLWDFTKADVSKITTDEYQEIVNVAKKYAHLRKGGRSALVLSKDVGYGIGRMYGALSEIENIPYEIRSFRDIKDAREWLGV
ncbi:MAG: hypothetical protein JRF39_02810 [Deltaproteobacteria bacterium]|jgi:hypothetical protein|nr:hypothetical protein [Deltaproteobacteria bacterium]